MTVKKKQLPKKLSGLIDIALADLSKAERSKYYTVEMSIYHFPDLEENKCLVCFAGAVMSQTLGADRKLNIDPDIFPLETGNKLKALDSVRCGALEAAFDWLERDLPYGLKTELDVTKYNEDPAEFKQDMKKISKLLKAVGE